jgi:glycoprotein-N-acetylgalactosamine 3-beta-galactosyltransferase
VSVSIRIAWLFLLDIFYISFFRLRTSLYLIVENLRLYLESEEIQLASNGGRYLPDGAEDTQTPLFLGRRFAEGGDRDRMFISGGSGYTLNKAALKTLVVDCFPECFPHMHTFSEDVMVATCLRKVRVILLSDDIHNQITHGLLTAQTEGNLSLRYKR